MAGVDRPVVALPPNL